MKVFYHNDLDGRCAGALVAYFTGNYSPEDYFEVDYVMDLSVVPVADGEIVYFVDYSFKENTLDFLKSLQERGCQICWIDHHTSSINLCNAHPELQSIAGIRDADASGALLTFKYFSPYGDAPDFVKYVSDYDCWKFQYEPQTTFFKLGIETVKYDALDEIWTRLLGEMWTSEIGYLIVTGRTIKGYVDKTNDYYREHFAYESEIAGHKCLVVNQKTNSWVFGSKYGEYPLVMVWVFDGTRYVYSIFSGNPEIDCSKIAESYGGGGHKGAAGFSSKELLFRKV